MEEFSPQREENKPSPTLHHTSAIFWAGAYAVCILTFAFFIGSLLSNHARQFVQLNARTLPPVARFSASSPPPGQAEAPVDDARVEQPAHKEASTSLANLTEKQINILLLGSDERDQDNDPARTDTMLLLTLNLEQRTLGMLSLPRDLWVPIPGYDLTKKINSAYVLGEKWDYPDGGGAQLAKDTVSSLIGQPVQYYGHINFKGFIDLIDLIGGIEIDVPWVIHDEYYPTADYGYQTFHLEAGPQLLDGETALKYVRTRNSDNDYGRIARQQQLLQAVMDKVLTADMIPTLIARSPQLMNAMRTSFNTDMPLTTAIDIARYVRSNAFETVREQVLDTRYAGESWSTEGYWILLPDRQKMRPMLNEFFATDPSPLPDTTLGAANPIAATGADARAEYASDAKDARVEILNGTGYPGIAAKVSTQLQAQGWQVVAIGNADRSDYQRTLLVNYNIDDTLAQEIGRQLNLHATLPTLPGLIISDLADLRIVVGQDYLKNVLGDSQ